MTAFRMSFRILGDIQIRKDLTLCINEQQLSAENDLMSIDCRLTKFSYNLFEVKIVSSQKHYYTKSTLGYKSCRSIDSPQ
jgi:hypothetical protein